MRILSILTIVCCVFLAACQGSSSGGTLEIEKTDSQQTSPAAANEIEIHIGMKEADVLRLLGPVENTERAEDGRVFLSYGYKRAEYVYTSNSDGVSKLVIGNYNPSPQAESTGQLTILTIVVDAAGKVSNFNYALMPY